MHIELALTKSLEENAGTYFDAAKKAKKKLAGAEKALQESKKKLQTLLTQEQHFLQEEEQKKAQKAAQRKKEWYEKFHWFFSSEGFLCIGGRDATSNEVIIKKYLDKGDLVFHTEMAGSPFFVVKDGQKAGEATLQEAAQATAVYSRGWKLGHTQVEVFSVKSEQVSKEAKAGEYLAKGSFMIYGKKNLFFPKLEFALGFVEELGQIIGGPAAAVAKKTKNYLVIIPSAGNEKKSDLAKKIKAKLKAGELDEIMKFLPTGGEVRR